MVQSAPKTRKRDPVKPNLAPLIACIPVGLNGPSAQSSVTVTTIQLNRPGP